MDIRVHSSIDQCDERAWPEPFGDARSARPSGGQTTLNRQRTRYGSCERCLAAATSRKTYVERRNSALPNGRCIVPLPMADSGERIRRIRCEHEVKLITDMKVAALRIGPSCCSAVAIHYRSHKSTLVPPSSCRGVGPAGVGTSQFRWRKAR